MGEALARMEVGGPEEIKSHNGSFSSIPHQFM